jgi:hypothetical protein
MRSPAANRDAPLRRQRHVPSRERRRQDVAAAASRDGFTAVPGGRLALPPQREAGTF